ncbi:MAG TPA: zinc-binding dehydrogenase [Cellvibrio sp.]|nr:zinc-binding dehydrogenase [Cellvibrio sp.]
MFTHSPLSTADMAAQHHLLNRIAQLIDTEAIKTTANRILSPIIAENFRSAHAQLESGKTIGKIILEKWPI